MRQDRNTQGLGRSGLIPTTSTASLGSQMRAETLQPYSERRCLLVWRQVEQRSNFQEILWVWVKAVQPRGHGRCHMLHVGHPRQQLDFVLCQSVYDKQAWPYYFWKMMHQRLLGIPSYLKYPVPSLNQGYFIFPFMLSTTSCWFKQPSCRNTTGSSLELIFSAHFQFKPILTRRVLSSKTQLYAAYTHAEQARISFGAFQTAKCKAVHPSRFAPQLWSCQGQTPAKHHLHLK